MKKPRDTVVHLVYTDYEQMIGLDINTGTRVKTR